VITTVLNRCLQHLPCGGVGAQGSVLHTSANTNISSQQQQQHKAASAGAGAAPTPPVGIPHQHHSLLTVLAVQ
jgi:hypothetical protein